MFRQLQKKKLKFREKESKKRTKIQKKKDQKTSNKKIFSRDSREDKITTTTKALQHQVEV